MQNWAPLIGGCAAGLFALTACSSPPSVNPPTASQASPGLITDSPSPTGSVQGPPSTSATPAATDFIATEALTDVGCEADGNGVWSFSGTLSNTGSEPVKYTVAVAVGTTSSVAGHAMIEKLVAAGSKENIRADAFATNAPADAKCEAVVSK
ncbi:hypothetical protein LJR078_002052 [Arthrobacter sp. LjRoot78]|uniref:hypothetical protein n=1 Tax=Arthrobacter sp. LjRoot78 TaxID=3342338 RepID=UPI003ECDCEBB